MMRTFILLSILTLFLSIAINSNAKAHFLLNYPSFSSEETNTNITKEGKSVMPFSNLDKETKPKSIEPTNQKTAKEQRKIKKQQRKEFRKTIWKTLKEHRKEHKLTKKENKKNGIKDSNKKIHWAAYLALIGGLTAFFILGAALIIGTTYAIFSYLGPFAIFLLPISIISGIIGISVALNDDDNKFNKTNTIAFSAVGGILAFVMLALLILLIIALSVAFS